MEGKDILEQNLKPAIDTKGLEKLIEEQSKGTRKSQETKKIWMKYKDDYINLQKQLETITDRVSHKVMVPFGRFALMPGTVKHTNEITVLLGDNWFAERSAKQATEIIDRRLKQCNEMLEQLEKEEQLYESWRRQTETIQNELSSNKGMEIVEPFNQEEENLWRKKHRESVKDHKQKLAEEKSNPTTNIPSNEEDLWRRLDELELQEELEHEADLLKDEDEESDSSSLSEESENADEDAVEPALPEKKHVTWSESDLVRSFHRDEVIDTKEEGPQAENLITFQHSKRGSQSNHTNESGAIQSPSDIYVSFNIDTSDAPEPKSILRVKKSTTPVRETPEPVKVPEKSISFSQVSPVGDEIKEREPLLTAPPSEEPTQPLHRPVSRFKAARQAARPLLP